jgi:predicted glycosyltransferase
VLDAVKLLDGRMRIRLEVFAGPFMENEEYEKLAGRAAADVRIRRYTRRFLDYLHAADLSLSLAGYNTCMNLLVSQVPALVYPYSRQREQPMRVEKIKGFFPMRALREEDMQPGRLCRQMQEMLQIKRTLQVVPIDLNGAANAAEFLSRWEKQSLK